MSSPGFSKILIAEEAASTPLAKRVKAAWPDIAPQIVRNLADHELRLDMEPDPVAAGKRILALGPNRGRFIRKCPGTMGLVCCNYWVIDLVEGCPIDCSYCILQGYLNDRRIRLATNLDDLVDEIDTELAGGTRPVRVGTGELSDSLILDPQLGLAKTLIDIFRTRPRATLELKTKTANIDSLLNLEPADNIVIGWSVNTPAIISSDERGASSLHDRLSAAGRIVERGWKVAFHFDPLVLHDRWEDGYHRVVEDIFSAASPERVAWISLGAFRFHPSLKQIIKDRFPMSDILNSEFVLCPDNKMRYVKPKRLKLFKSLNDSIAAKAPSTPLYLCMEGVEIWESVFGGSPRNNKNLCQVFG